MRLKPVIFTKGEDEQKKREDEPAALSLADTAECLLGKLEPKQAQVLKLRYGLENGESLTLEEVGRKFSVTRERVRQIQAKALKRLNHLSKKEYREQISSPLETLLRGAGGVLRESEIHNGLPEVASIGNFHPAGLSRFILQLSPKFLKIEDEVWALADCSLKCYKIVISEAVRVLEKHKSRMRFNILVAEIKHTLVTAKTMLDSLFIEGCIRANSSFTITCDGWCGLTKWHTRYMDKIVEMLRAEGKPLHYSAIARRVNSLLRDKQVAEHNVHALLQRERDIFVRVDKGTYSLVEWGTKTPLYYLDIITEILEDEGKPLKAEDILRRVEEMRPCTRTSVIMYLTLNDRFAEFSPGLYGLREWLPEETEQVSSRLSASFIDELKKRVMCDLASGNIRGA